MSATRAAALPGARPSRLPERGEGLLGLPRARQQEPEVKVGLGHLRVRLHRVARLGDCLVRLALRPARAGLAARLLARPSAGAGETRSDSHFARKIPGPFPLNSHAMRSVEPGPRGDEARQPDGIHLEGEASRFR